MTSPAAWWRELSASDRYRFYTRLSFQVVPVVPIPILAGEASLEAVAGLVVCALITVVAIDAHPALRLFRRPRWPAVTVPIAAVALVLLFIASAAGSRRIEGSLSDDLVVVSVFAVFYLALSIIAFRPRPWLWVGVLSVAAAGIIATSWSDAVMLAVIVAGIGAIAAGIAMATRWGLDVIDELEDAQEAQARLRVAEERLRFSRDLHDVVGRGFSAIAVKSELAATLARAGRPERSAEEMDEVKGLAVESMEQMRELVRGYRDISLESEVAGARSLLSAAGCDLRVQGEVNRVPTGFHEVAAWVVREGTTNIVKHSSATQATLTLGASGMSLRNDAPRAADESGEPRSGHDGLTERLGAVGASMTTQIDHDEFVLEVRWDATGSTR